MKIAICPNIIKDKSFFYTLQVIEKLKTLKVEILMSKEYLKYINNNESIYFYDDIEDLIYNSDIVLTIGGDGTLIKFAKYAANYEKPILGINLGRVGFVTGLEKNELFKLDLLYKNDFKIQKRTMLKITTEGETNKTFFAVNDMVVSRGELSKIIDFSIFLDGNEVCNYRADGIIVSTSTGSTAYSLSAGGPIVDPSLDCMILTPICSHSMFARPIVFSNQASVIVNVKSRENSKVFLYVDGNNVLEVTDCNKIKVECSNKTISMISFDERSFYKRLSEKLSARVN